MQIIVLVLFTWFGTRTTDADKVVGNWISPKSDFIVECYKAKDGSYHGRMLWFKKLEGKNRYNCEIPEDQWVGKDILWGLSYEDEEWSGGQLKDLKSCKTYDAHISMQSKNELTITGYIVFKMLGESMTFSKYHGELPKQE